MAGPPDFRSLPASGWRPADPALGAAPKDGDFARLLEAASAPAAHRMKEPPEIEGWGSTRARRRVPYGSPGMLREHADADAAASGDRPTDPMDIPGEGIPQAVRGTAAGDRSGAGSTPPRLPALVRGWSDRPLRDRIVAVLFGLAGLWVLLGVIDAAARSGGEDLGVLAVLALVAFFVLRGWLRSRRSRTGSR